MSAVGFPRFFQRSLRRMFITEAIRRGVNVRVLASWQGHVDGGKLISDTYSDEVNRAESLRMAALLGDEHQNVVPICKGKAAS